MRKISINRHKIDASLVRRANNGDLYLNAVLMENRDGVDQYGNDGYIVQDVSKEEREAGKKGPIIGNWKRLQRKPKDGAAPAKPVGKTPDEKGEYNW
jgi:hypothetical protein